MSYRSFLIAITCTAFPFLASANPLSIQKLPEGMCALDAKIPEQATIIQSLTASTASGNELITSFASCDELKAVADKKAPSISHYGSVLRQPALTDLTMNRPLYIAGVATAMGQSSELTQAALGTVNAMKGQVGAASGITVPTKVGAVSKGVLYQDPRMIIIGFEQTNTFGNQPTKVASVAGMTLIGSAPVSVNLYAPLTDKDAFAVSADALKPTINRMIRDNN